MAEDRMNNVLVSVAITTYKRPIEILSRAINSVLEQSYYPIEIILVNDFPEDKDLSIKIKNMLDKIAKNTIVYIEHIKNMGGCAARNSAIKVAKGKYIAFLDDDDSWEKGKIEKELNCFDNDVGMVYCQCILHDENGNMKKSNLKGYAGNIFPQLLEWNFIGSTSCVLLRTEYLKKIGGFDVDLKACQDYDVWLRMAKFWKVAFCNEYLVNYYFQEDNLSRNEQKRKAGFDSIMEKYNRYYKKDRSLKNKYLNMVVIACLGMKHYRLAMGYYIKALKTSFFSMNNFFWMKKGMIYFWRTIKDFKSVL